MQKFGDFPDFLEEVAVLSQRSVVFHQYFHGILSELLREFSDNCWRSVSFPKVPERHIQKFQFLPNLEGNNWGWRPRFGVVLLLLAEESSLIQVCVATLSFEGKVVEAGPCGTWIEAENACAVRRALGVQNFHTVGPSQRENIKLHFLYY